MYYIRECEFRILTFLKNFEEEIIIKGIWSIFLPFIIMINFLGNLFGIGDIIPTEVETTTIVQEESSLADGTTESTTAEETTTKITIGGSSGDTSEPSDVPAAIEKGININGKVIQFGSTQAEVTAALGKPTDAITETTEEGKVYISLVYAADYTKMSIFQFSSGVLGHIYTVDKGVTVSDGENTLNLSVAEKNSDALPALDGASFEIHRDKLNANSPYAFEVKQNGFRYSANDFTKLDGQEKLVFHITNADRARYGLSKLAYCDRAARAARLHSADMEINNNFTHDSIDGSELDQRLIAQGLVPLNYWGENIAAGYTSPFALADALLNSPVHRYNILFADYTHVGVGYSNILGGYPYITQDFYKLFPVD